MHPHKIFHLGRIILLVLVLISLVGCAAGGEANEIAASSSFVCPEPNPRIEFESTSINILTWTEYVPEEIIECFGLMYGVEVNADYFSTNEELYSKVAIGDGVNVYDVVHPSDYMIGVLMREELLQEIDQNKLPNITNLDESLLEVYGDTLNFIVPYQMGTQGIVYNSETVTPPPTSWAD